MKMYQRLLTLLLVSAPMPSLGADIVACIVAGVPNNPNYLGTATTVTKLKCEFTNANYYPTLPDLYRQGWRVIEVLGAEQTISRGGQGVSPLYLLEREAVPAAAPAAEEAKPSGRNNKR